MYFCNSKQFNPWINLIHWFEFDKRKCIQWFLKQMLELISQLLCSFHQMGGFSAWKSSWWSFTSEISFAQDTDVLPIEKHHSLHFSFFILKSCKSGFPSFYVGEWGAFVEGGWGGAWRWHFTTDISCLKLHSSIQETLLKVPQPIIPSIGKWKPVSTFYK